MAHRVTAAVCPLCGAAEYLSPRAIATEYGVHYRTVWRHIKSGDLVGRKFGKAWRIRRSDLEAYLSRLLPEPHDPENPDA